MLKKIIACEFERKLPNELVVTIFDTVLKGCNPEEQANQLAVLRAVSRRWRQNAEHTHPCLALPPDSQKFPPFIEFAQRFQNATIVIKEIDMPSINLLGLQHVTSLDLSKLKYSTSPSMNRITIIDPTDLTHIKAILQKSPNLRELNLSGSRFIKAELLPIIEQHCPKLHKLNLRGCTLVHSEAIADMQKNYKEKYNIDLAVVMPFPRFALNFQYPKIDISVERPLLIHQYELDFPVLRNQEELVVVDEAHPNTKKNCCTIS